jgi:hypothetical protein
LVFVSEVEVDEILLKDLRGCCVRLRKRWNSPSKGMVHDFMVRRSQREHTTGT